MNPLAAAALFGVLALACTAQMSVCAWQMLNARWDQERVAPAFRLITAAALLCLMVFTL